jgi:hypothetical protein
VELLVELLAELVIYVVGEMILDLGLRKAGRAVLYPRESPIISLFAYAAFGALFGLISLLVFPDAFVSEPSLRVLSLFSVPLLTAGLVTGLGRFFRKRKMKAVHLDSFALAFALAASIALVRFFGTL